MSVVLPSGLGGHIPRESGLRAYSDPVIFCDDRVLKTLLSKEGKYVPLSEDYFEFQKNLQPHMRKEVADWMLEVCEAERCQPEIFCLAMNYMDRFLCFVKIGQNQLQLLGSVCLLVACKVRQHTPLPALKLVEYSDFNLDLTDIMEWEVLLLSKLDWDMSAVIALDFVEHIIQRVQNLGWNSDIIRSHSESLVAMCSANHSFYNLPPSLVASSCVLATLRPLLETHQRLPNLEQALQMVEKITYHNEESVKKCMEQIKVLVNTTAKPSSPKLSTPKKSFKTPSGDAEETTPTKVLDVAKQN